MNVVDGQRLAADRARPGRRRRRCAARAASRGRGRWRGRPRSPGRTAAPSVRRSSWASSQTLPIVTSSASPGAAAVRYWKIRLPPSSAGQRARVQLVAQPLLLGALGVDRDAEQARRHLGLAVAGAGLRRTSPRCAPARPPRTRSSASRARAAARPSAAATVVLPTPPLPVTTTSRLSRRRHPPEDRAEGIRSARANRPSVWDCSSAPVLRSRLNRRHP